MHFNTWQDAFVDIERRAVAQLNAEIEGASSKLKGCVLFGLVVLQTLVLSCIDLGSCSWSLYMIAVPLFS